MPEQWRGDMRLLVAGGGGYVGSKLIPKLLERNYEISVVDTFLFGNHLPDNVYILDKNLFNLTEPDLQGYDQVLFLSGLSNDPMAEYSPNQNFISNAAAPAYLAYVAKRAGVKRYIYASTCSVYGYTEEELYDEESPTTVQFAYGVSKLQGEKAVWHMRDDNFSVIALRKGTVSGYSPRMRLDLVVNTMFKTALQTGTITVNNPAIWRPILSLDDACSAYIRAVESYQSISGVFNIASDNYTLGAIGDEVKTTIEKLTDRQIKFEIRHMQDIRNYKVSINRAKNVLSFNPTGSVRSIVHDLHENLAHFHDFDNPNYYNIEVFKRYEQEREKKNDTTV
jgi:nucleoside-diphosphate-sugar epimerase